MSAIVHKRGAYTARLDGRKNDQMRPIEAKVGVIKNADGSAYFKIGGTAAYAAVYGPRELHPKFMQNPKTGILRCYYNMMPFSGAGERVRPGGNRRSKELSHVITQSIEPVVDLTPYPNAVVDVFIELTETDAGSRCAGICAASMALAHAGIEMKDMPAAIAVGKIGDQVVVDLTGDEEHFEGGATDIAVSVLPLTGDITLLQMDGEITAQELVKALAMAQEAAKKIYKIQTKALKDHYKSEARQ
ncbi:MAG TPA: exosome complex exonuclease Rrp41 [Candidatus Nanoarchaeia archaeon]|nr:exosome complex exonuclease Rrp41 [Candidatus Nanoarchaeia archaeon]